MRTIESNGISLHSRLPGLTAANRLGPVPWALKCDQDRPVCSVPLAVLFSPLKKAYCEADAMGAHKESLVFLPFLLSAN